jgi:DegV family protein with EDD domain
MQLQGDKNMNTRIIVDSTTELMPEYRERVKVIPLIVRFGEEEYIDGVTIDHKTFYEKLIESDVLPATSQANPDTFMRAFDEIKAADESAVVITLSSKLSGTYQSAIIAAEDYDNIYVVDSGTVTIGASILTELALKYLDEGMDARTVAEKLEEDKKKIHIVALVDTLEYLKKGGRISKTVAFAGTLLNIKPVISVTDGEINMLGKARGSKMGNNLLVQEIEKAGGIDFSKPVLLGYSGLSDILLKKYIEDSRHIWDSNLESVRYTTIGSVIGTHAGPGAIAVAFFKK